MLRTDLNIRLTPALSKVIGSYTLEDIPEFAALMTLLTGTGANQADKLYYAKPTIAGSATLSLDLNGGGLKDTFGDNFDIARLKGLLLKNDAANPNTINLQRPASNGVAIFGAAGGNEPVHPGGLTVKWWPGATAIVVTPTTGDLLEIVNTAAGSVTPEIWLIGASA